MVPCTHWAVTCWKVHAAHEVWKWKLVLSLWQPLGSKWGWKDPKMLWQLLTPACPSTFTSPRATLLSPQNTRSQKKNISGGKNKHHLLNALRSVVAQSPKRGEVDASAVMQKKGSIIFKETCTPRLSSEHPPSEMLLYYSIRHPPVMAKSSAELLNASGCQWC